MTIIEATFYRHSLISRLVMGNIEVTGECDMASLKPLGAEAHLETVAVLKATNNAAAALGELKGTVAHNI